MRILEGFGRVLGGFRDAGEPFLARCRPFWTLIGALRNSNYSRDLGFFGSFIVLHIKEVQL